jgi:hypothetical membrane protein
MTPALIRAGLLCGLVAPVLWAAVIVLAGELRPGFDHVGQYISELGERGSATAALMTYAGFVATGLMHIAFAAAFDLSLIRLGARRLATLLTSLLIGLNGVGRIGAGVFPCEPGCASPEALVQRLHSLSATIAFLALIAATLLAALSFRRIRRLRSLWPYSLASGCAALAFLALMSASEATHGATGLYERLASGVLSLWIFTAAARLWWLTSQGREGTGGN